MTTIYFAHGKESGPWGSKIRYLAEIASKHGYSIQSPDYSSMDNPDDRIEHLLQLLENEQPQTEVILVGSSMGGYVSTVVSSRYKLKGMFLMAPALYMSGYQVQSYPACGCPVTVVHGWNDDVIPVEHSIEFAKQGKYNLHLINSDHRLNDQLDAVGTLFELFLSC